MQRDADMSPPPDASETDTAIEVRNASVTFGMERGESRVLNDVDLDIHRGEILGVVGESGSGKSMLASSLLDAVVEPGHLSGDITYYPEDGDPVNLLSLDDQQLKDVRWGEIAFVIQAAQSAFNPTMTIRSHFVETLRAHNHPVEPGLERARELLSDLYLDTDLVLSSYPYQLSGGMKQRALIALSLILDPEILVMDEPTAALDLLMQRSITSLLYEIQEKYNLTLVFVTHDLPLVADIADRIAVMYAFEVAEIGPTEELLEHAAHPYTRALLNSVPNLSRSADETTSIPGSSPDPVNVPDGCSYSPRCPLADEQCRRERPPFHEAADDHRTACFHWQRTTEEIPLMTHGESGADR